MTSNHYQMESELPWLTEVARRNRLPVAFALVQTDATPDTWAAAVQPSTRMLFVETPSNPGLALIDLPSSSPAYTRPLIEKAAAWAVLGTFPLRP
jgi:hypothetical protein